MNPPDDPVVTTTRSGIEIDPIGLRDSAARSAARSDRNAERRRVADVADVERRAGRPARAVCGAGAAGWPTSICTTRPPAASIRAAAAITSITMKGGTSLRAEGAAIRAKGSIIMRRLFLCGGPCRAVANAFAANLRS